MHSASVIIPTLNEESTIGPLLGRLTNQEDAGSLEIIVVDGGSSDATVEIVNRYEGVKLLNSQAGVSRQRNVGAAFASSAMLVFLDADTSPSAGYIGRLQRAYVHRTFSVACPWFYPLTYRPDIHAVYGVLNSLFFLSQYRFHAGAGVSIATPRDIFMELGGFDETLHLGEDVDYIVRAAKIGRHRHLFVPLGTSARRFEKSGVLRTALFYAKISPSLIKVDLDKLRTLEYPPIRK